MTETRDQRIEQWENDCVHWHGMVLKGAHAHWCSIWDFLPIDETSKEFEACLCEKVGGVYDTDDGRKGIA